MSLIRVPGKGVIKGPAGVGLFRVPPVVVGPVVTGISLSPATGTANSASGTVVGTLTAATTGVALTSPVWTLLTSAGGDFQIINGNQVAFLPGNVPTGSYSLSVQVASSNAPTFSQAVAVAISAASGGTGIPAPVPVAAGVAITSVQMRNLASSTATNPAVSYVQGFARAAVPNAASAHLVIAGMTVQQDAETYYSDGSLKQAVLTLQPSSIAATTTTTAADISWASGAPNRTAGVTLAQIAANSDIRLQLTGFDLGTDVFELSVNDVISGGTAFPWGTNPVQGWRKTRSGSVQTEWMFWCFVKRASDGARHRWIKAKLWLSALSPTVYRIRAKVSQPNVFGPHPAGTVGATDGQEKHAFNAVLKNGATTVHVWGGASDIRVKTLPGSAFDPATQIVTTPNIFIPYNGTAVSLSVTGGTLPTPLTSGRVYFMSWPDPAQTTKARLFDSRWGSVQGVSQPWVPGTSDPNTWYPQGAYNHSARYTSLGELWTVRPLVNGTDSYGRAYIEPSGASPFTDTSTPTLVWNRLTTGPITAAGTGTINILPVNVLHPFCAVDLVDLTTGDRIWIGAAPHQVLAAPEITYYTRKTHLTPPYDLNVAITPGTGVSIAWPGAIDSINIDINYTGDDPGDERIAPLNHTAARAILRPFDASIRSFCLFFGTGFSDYHANLEDEASGVMPIGNAGPARNGVPYPNLPLRTDTRSYPYASSGVAAPKPLLVQDDGYIERYIVWCNGTHLPNLAYGPYLISGDDAFLDGLVNLYTGHVLGQSIDGSPGAHQVFDGITYYYTGSVDSHEFARNNGWGMNLIGNVNHVLPADRPERQYVTDIYNDSAFTAGAVYKTMPASKKAFGIYSAKYFDTYEQPWMEDFCFQAFAREALRGDHPGWYDVLSNHMVKYSLGRMDPNGVIPGGCAYFAGTREVVLTSNPGQEPATYFTSFADVWTQSLARGFYRFHMTYSGCPTTGFLPDPSGSIPSGPTSLAQHAQNTVIYSCLLGLPHATDVLADMKARMLQDNGGADNYAKIANYPEFSWGYYP